MDIKDPLKNLNPSQRDAATIRGSHLLIVAGPGTGKTRVLTCRILNLMKDGIRPEGILGITFTNKAASEIESRLRKARVKRMPRICTFHSWAYELLSKRLGKRPYVLSEGEQMELLKQAAEKANIKAQSKDLFEKLLLLKQDIGRDLSDEDEGFCRLWKEYHGLLDEYGVYDYDDLLRHALAILEEEGKSTSGPHPLAHVLVDEFQDVNPVQYRLVQLLGRYARVTAIGDPNQAIYGFRGASPTFLERLEKDFSPVKVVSLDIAYRCPRKILDAASHVVGSKKDLVSASKARGSITLKLFDNEHREASWIAGQIDRLCGGVSFESFNESVKGEFGQIGLSDICILYRARALSAPLEEALLRRGIPFHSPAKPASSTGKAISLLNHLMEFSRGRAADFHLSRLGLTLDEARELSARLSDVIGKKGGLDEFLDDFKRALKVEFQEEEKARISQHLFALTEDLPSSVIFKEEQDQLDFSVEAVTLMTLHASKGLEFPIVFLAGVERDILPWQDSDRDEERRLLYVGMTRSSERLFVSFCKTRRLYGKRMATGISPFLKFLEGHVEILEEKRRRRKKSLKKKQKTLF